MPPTVLAYAAMLGSIVVLGGTTLLAACGTPPELRRPPLPTAAPRPSVSDSPEFPYPSGGPSGFAEPPLPGLPSYPVVPAPTTGTADATAALCGTEPSAAQVLAAIRRSPGLLPDGVRLRVTEGPRCAGTWQYTVVRILLNPEPEPLQVVTRGRATALSVVTSGTDVCSIDVRTQAPLGIRALACEAGPGGTPGGTPAAR